MQLYVHLELHKELTSEIISTSHGIMQAPTTRCSGRRDQICKACLAKPKGLLHLIAAQMHADQKPELCIAFALIYRDPGIYLDLLPSEC